ncbi:odorant receptor 134 [Nasonia vitripennis]|uniref:Odorant receptor n=1 Tax=Nasonia vitripennis TaxID=7425 RepID=A0A7M6W8J4_NASVI|nr:odorant receptor 134 [Nasonia vitripennis]
MEIYDSKYFIHNKRFQMALGVWPYQNRVKNLSICGVLLLVMFGMLIPQLLRLRTYLGKDIDKSMENIFILLYTFGIYIKLFTAHIAENKMKILYESTAKNFETYTDEAEKKIMKQYSERGRLITLAFLIYMVLALILFVMLPLYPIIMDATIPLDLPRPRISVLNGDYLVDENDYYFQIYVFDSIACTLTVFIMCSTDPMYAAIVEHCLGLFSICKYRLKNFNKSCGMRMVERADAERYGGDYAYAALVRAILLHKEILKYTQIIQTSYSLYFLLEMGVTVGILTATSVIIVMKLERPLDCLRYFLVFIGLLVHIFYLTWPGQKLIDFSGDIFQDTYLNDWYKSSLKCQNLLRFMSLRCSRPCELSGCGLYVMNLINFAAILKSSASYITVFSSV